jgi:hypothetical protein
MMDLKDDHILQGRMLGLTGIELLKFIYRRDFPEMNEEEIKKETCECYEVIIGWGWDEKTIFRHPEIQGKGHYVFSTKEQAEQAIN